MENLNLRVIGTVKNNGEDVCIELDKRYADALKGLDGFGHINVLWWFSGFDGEDYRNILTAQSPYKSGPDVIGTFASRSPMRPNPLGLSCAGITYIDAENAVVGLDYIDAEDATPVLDIKPYTPSLDRVENPAVPEWCGHWPKSVEVSGDFDWEKEFNF